MTILIPMAGLATRFVNEGINTPKPLILANGLSLIEHTLNTLGLDGKHVFVTRKYPCAEDNARLSAMLKRLRPHSVEICLAEPTCGAVATCLAAVQHIDPSNALVVTNCDQRTEWDANEFMQNVVLDDCDGAVVTHESQDPKHSYADIRNGRVIRIVEKQVISHDALVGIHYYRHGGDFIWAAQQLVADAQREPYVSETYNPLIAEGKTIVAYRLPANGYIPLGTPYDVALYEAKVREYQTAKPKNLFVDLDGTILKHLHRFSELHTVPPSLLDGVRAKMNEWDSIGHRIILCTARKESARAMTEAQLRELGLCWDELVMGLTSGDRVLVNDKLTDAAPDRAVAINVATNKGFDQVDWRKLGL